MSEENNEEITNGDDFEPAQRRKVFYTIAAAIGVVVVVGGLIVWYLRGREGGNIVPAPRTVSFGDNTGPPASDTAGEQTVTIQPDQIDKIGLKTETVGETLSSEAMTVAATGVVQANAYKETPVISLVGGVLRKVSGELGQNVRRGQSLAVIFSDELAASQSRYLALQTAAQTARQNYDRTARLVKISPASNSELDQALAALKTADAE